MKLELQYPEKDYFLMARDEQGKRYIWGFYFPTLEKAKQRLLPGTWVIDEEDNEVARYGE